MILDVLATFRLQRLLGVDSILDRPRDWVSDRSPFLDELLSCPYCRSVWSAAAVVGLRRVPGGQVIRDVLALSAAAAMLTRIEID